MTEKNEPDRNISPARNASHNEVGGHSDADGEKKHPNQNYRNFLVSQKVLIYDYEKKSFLLLKLKNDNSSFAKKYGLWDVPGGRTNSGEGLEKSLNREIKEEIGDVDIEIRGLVNFEEIEYRSGAAVVAWYIAKYVSGEITLSEHSEYKWETGDNILTSKNYNSWIKEAAKKAAEYLENQNALDSWKRCQADFENYKKDQAKYLEEFRKYAKMDVIEQILPVVDNFETSLAHVPAHSKEDKWVEGIVYIKKQLEDVLKNNDIEEIKVKAGDKLNPEIHEAVAGEGKKQKVAKIIQKGYKLNGRIFRAAKVEVE